LMYLRQAWRLKHKLPPPRGLRLPSLEWLRRANARATAVSLMIWGVGVLSGVVLNFSRAAQQAAPLPWHDPLIISSVIMFAWLLVATVVALSRKSAPHGRRVAYLPLVSFVLLLAVLGVLLLINTEHGGKGETNRVHLQPEVPYAISDRRL